MTIAEMLDMQESKMLRRRMTLRLAFLVQKLTLRPLRSYANYYKCAKDLKAHTAFVKKESDVMVVWYSLGGWQGMTSLKRII
jgi:hypothetical protein